MTLRRTLSAAAAIAVASAIAAITTTTALVTAPSSFPSSPVAVDVIVRGRHPPPPAVVDSRRRRPREYAAALRYRYYQDDADSADYDVIDVDGEGGGERKSLRSLLDDDDDDDDDPTVVAATTMAKSRSRTVINERRTTSTVIELHSIEDYRERVLLLDRDLDRIERRRDGSNDDDVVDRRPCHDAHRRDDDGMLRVVRFSAPWCKTCRTTNVAWERMAARIASAPDCRVRFYSVVINGGANSPSNALRDMLGITSVPGGIIHHPAVGVMERKVDLDRANMALLRKALECYVLDGGTNVGLELDGLGGGGGGDGGIAA
ncbi:hypothetical protein ACHAXA_004705 [Cyclostephanos tholiformis]|uniref:Thioredoxin domain-containing protein n=1 Tax=Cyclostephanos tholiformis TaxID=382380 RepID=A0ABD3SS85_9STRA